MTVFSFVCWLRTVALYITIELLFSTERTCGGWFGPPFFEDCTPWLSTC